MRGSAFFFFQHTPSTTRSFCGARRTFYFVCFPVRLCCHFCHCPRFALASSTSSITSFSFTPRRKTPRARACDNDTVSERNITANMCPPQYHATTVTSCCGYFANPGRKHFTMFFVRTPAPISLPCPSSQKRGKKRKQTLKKKKARPVDFLQNTFFRSNALHWHSYGPDPHSR